MLSPSWRASIGSGRQVEREFIATPPQTEEKQSALSRVAQHNNKNNNKTEKENKLGGRKGELWKRTCSVAMSRSISRIGHEDKTAKRRIFRRAWLLD